MNATEAPRTAPQHDTITLEVIDQQFDAATLRRALLAVEGVTEVNIEVASRRVGVGFAPGALTASQLCDAAAKAGIRLTEPATQTEPPGWPNTQESLLVYKWVAAGLTGALLLAATTDPLAGHLSDAIGISALLAAMAVLTLPVHAWAGAQFYRGAWLALRRGTVDINSLVAACIVVLLLYSVLATLVPSWFASAALEPGHALGARPPVYYETVLLVLAFVLFGRWVEGRAWRSATDAVTRLAGSEMAIVRVLRAGRATDVPVQEIRAGETMLVGPGELVPVDGVVGEGYAAVDESVLTGDGVHVEKSAGDTVYGGTINSGEALRLRVTRTGSTTAWAGILRLVEGTWRSRTPGQRAVDYIATLTVPAVMLIAAITFGLWSLAGPEGAVVYAVLNTAAVLIIAAPQALRLAAPATLAAATTRGAAQGMFFRDAEALETAQRVDTLVLDGAGTITEGRPAVSAIVTAGIEERELLRLAAAAERGSGHTPGEAIVREAWARALSLPAVTDSRAVPGKGVCAGVEGRQVVIGTRGFLRENGIDLGMLAQSDAVLQSHARTVVHVALDGKAAGVIAIADGLKPTAAQAVYGLKQQGVHVILMTGDNAATAHAIAEEVAINQVIPEVLPHQKVGVVRNLQDYGKIVALAGTERDAGEALAQAHLGIVIGTGAGGVSNMAEIVLTGNDPLGITRAIALSRAAMRTIRRNLLWAFAYNVALIPLAAGLLYLAFGDGDVPSGLRWLLGEHGFVNPIVAAGAAGLSSTLVMLNSLRLKSAPLPPWE